MLLMELLKPFLLGNDLAWSDGEVKFSEHVVFYIDVMSRFHINPRHFLSDIFFPIGL